MKEAGRDATLIVILRGWGKVGLLPDGFRQMVANGAENVVLRVANLDMGYLSLADPWRLVDCAFRQIDDWVREIDPVRIILIGYSAGSLIARGVVLRAHGSLLRGDADAFPDPCAWAGRIERVVYLAGILRGWTISSATPKLQRFLHPVASALVRLYGAIRGATPFILRCERGEAFVVDLRLRYLALQRSDARLPLFVFLLGTQDEFISPADALDVQVGPGMAFIEIPGSNHGDIGEVMRDGETASVRRDRLSRAIFDTQQMLADFAVHHEDIDDYLEPMDRRMTNPYDPEVTDAVIVLHGIRDEGYWTKRIARAIKEEGNRMMVRAPSPSYGYFSMWNFLSRSARIGKTKWLLEQYCDVLICFPNARISFVGHSNGTYLLVKALELCQSVRFHRIYFAGSVVRRDFPWRNYAGRVGRLVNVTAGDDVVVALFPGFMEALGLRRLEVGGAGHRGFDRGDQPDFVTSIGPLRGGHGAGVSEAMWPGIARYIADGTLPTVPERLRGRDPADPPLRLKVLTGRLFLMLAPLMLGFGVWAVAMQFGLTLGVVLGAAFVWLIWRVVRFY